jgi:uncharacterized protein (TIGR02246 family)
MSKVRFAMVLALLVAGAPLPHLWAQSADEAAIKKIEQLWDENWNRHDPKGMAAVLAEDADFVNVNGAWFKGRSAFEALMTRAHAMQFKESTRTTLATTVKFLTPEIAVVHSTWRISGDRKADGSLLPQPREGVMTRVVVKRSGTWVVVAAHNTNSVPNQ